MALSKRKIFNFWYPLSATWLMMSIEGPYLSAIIARLPEPKYNLAAYGIAFAIALIVESPVIMMMSASTALVKDRQSYLKLRNFSNFLNLVVTAGILIVLIPPLFCFLTVDLMNLDIKVSELTYKAVAILLPWPGAIGIRRFYQGILIRNNLTKRVAYGTIIRLLSMSVTALCLFLFTGLEGVVVGAGALSAGVITEAFASRVMVHSSLRKIKQTDLGSDLTYFGIWNFYYPLIMTSFLSLGVHPLVTFFMGQARMSLESLAVLPVINSLVFIFRSVGLSYQEVVIALIGEKFENRRQIKEFAVWLGGTAFVLLGLIAYTPLNELWFHSISGLSIELTNFAHLPLMILAVIPVLSVVISYQRSLLVASKNTSPITLGTSLEVFGIIIMLIILIIGFDIVGVVAAAAAFVFGRFLANVYLTKHVIIASKRMSDN